MAAYYETKKPVIIQMPKEATELWKTTCLRQNALPQKKTLLLQTRCVFLLEVVATGSVIFLVNTAYMQHSLKNINQGSFAAIVIGITILLTLACLSFLGSMIDTVYQQGCYRGTYLTILQSTGNDILHNMRRVDPDQCAIKGWNDGPEHDYHIVALSESP